MSNVGKDFIQWMQDLSSRTFDVQVKAARRYGEWVSQLARPGGLGTPAREDMLRDVGAETSRYARSLSSLTVDYYNDLYKLNRTYGERFFEEVVHGGASGPAGRRDDAPDLTAVSHEVEIVMRGAVGEEVVSSFVLENKLAEPADISFLVSDFRGPEGTAPFRPPLQIDPARARMEPGEEQRFVVRLTLTPDAFAPDQHYRARALVHGYDYLELLLEVRTNPPASSDPPADPQPPRSKSRKSRKDKQDEE